MPINIIIGLVALLVALVLYSLGAWGAFRAKGVTRRHVTLFFVGFAFDVTATAMMAIQAGGLDLSPLSDLLHTVVALLAMVAMLVVAVLGNKAVSSGDAELGAKLPRWMLSAWVLWVIVFLWGMASRGSARMGG